MRRISQVREEGRKAPCARSARDEGALPPFAEARDRAGEDDVHDELRRPDRARDVKGVVVRE